MTCSTDTIQAKSQNRSKPMNKKLVISLFLITLYSNPVLAIDMNGTSKTISANNTTVWWNNKIHVIKDKEMFVNLTEGIFFLEDLQTK